MSDSSATSRKGRMPLSFQDMPQNLQAEFNEHWLEAQPKEAVGLLLADGSVLRLRNWSRKPGRFLVGYWKIFRELGWGGLMRGEGVSMIYHSHNIEAFPSQTDREFMAVMAKKWPHVKHLIFVPATEYGVWE